ncbi:TPA: hypothetical protein I8Y99_000679 [Legionella pneumophila]|nr:hypothetical protein [Legionella pneumophila]
MLKNYLRSTIIVLIQAILPIFAILLIIPWLFNHSSSLMQLQHQLTTMKPWFLIFHGVFYLVFILLWPKIIHRFQQQNELNNNQLNVAKNARWYLLATFILIDLLMLWR